MRFAERPGLGNINAGATFWRPGLVGRSVFSDRGQAKLSRVFADTSWAVGKRQSRQFAFHDPPAVPNIPDGPDQTTRALRRPALYTRKRDLSQLSKHTALSIAARLL